MFVTVGIRVNSVTLKFEFESDNEALQFCALLANRDEITIVEYETHHTTSVNGAIASVFSAFNIDLTK